MTRSHWVLLIIGALVIAAGTLFDRSEPPAAEPLPPELASEPELYMRGAIITQFNDDGSLRYRLNTDQLFHFPEQQRSLLEEPKLHFIRQGDAPWDVSSRRGRVVYVTENDAEREIVHLEEDVELLRQRVDENRFLKLQTSLLTVYPDTQYAETDEHVIITTEVGVTEAEGMTARLATGKLLLGGRGENQSIDETKTAVDPSKRVTTVISDPSRINQP